MRVIAHDGDPEWLSYLIAADDGPLDAGTVVQVIGMGEVVCPPVSLGSLTAHDPYTDWQLIEDPPPLAEVLADVIEWPDDVEHPVHGRPFLTREIGERIIAKARSAER